MKFYDRNKPFSDQLKEARKKIGYSQRALSKELELPIRTIENWETSQRTPPAWTAELILEKLYNMNERRTNPMKREELLKALFEKFGTSETPVTVYVVAKCEATFDGDLMTISGQRRARTSLEQGMTLDVNGDIFNEDLCYFLDRDAASEYRRNNYPDSDVTVTSTFQGKKVTNVVEYYVDEQRWSYNDSWEEYDFLEGSNFDCFSEMPEIEVDDED